MPGTHPELIHANQGRWESWLLFVIGEVNTLSRRRDSLSVCISHTTHTHKVIFLSTHLLSSLGGPQLMEIL